MRRSWQTIIVATALLALLGCATERPTRPAPSTPLPAWAITQNPILHSAVQYTAVAVNESTFVVNPHLDPDFASVGTVDIRISCALEYYLVEANLYVLKPKDSMVVKVEAREPNTIGGLFENRVITLNVGDFDGHLADWLDPAESTLTFYSHDIAELRAQAIIRDPHYQTVSFPINSYPGATMYRQGEVFVHARFWDNTGTHSDSVLVFSEHGEKLRVESPAIFSMGPIHNMAAADDNIWIMRGSRPIHFVLCDSSFTRISEFVSNEYGDRYSSGIILRDESFWLCDKYGGQLLRIDADSSLLLGTMVVVDSVPFEVGVRAPLAAGSDGRFFYIVASVGSHEGLPIERTRVFDGKGRLVHDLPVLRYCRGLTWDGEAMWAVYRGPVAGDTGPSVLARLSMR